MIKKFILILLFLSITALTGLTQVKAKDWYKNDSNYLKILRITPSGNNTPTGTQIVLTSENSRELFST